MTAMKVNKHIEIVRSSNPALRSLGQVSCRAIFEILSKHYRKVGITIVNNLSDLEDLITKQPDLVFLGMRFIEDGPDKIWLSAYLDECGITYTGSAQAAHFLEYDKAAAKKRIIDAGLATAPFYVARQVGPSTASKTELKFPLFVKPLSCGGGLGIDGNSLVHSHNELSTKVRSIANGLIADSLVEEYLPGREFTVAILKDEVGVGFLCMSLELIAPMANGVRILSGKIKSADTERAVLVNNPATKSRVEEFALDVFCALGARDYGRIDIRLSKDGVPNFLEANLTPSLLSGYGSFPKACIANIGLDYESMILRIVKLAINRSYSEQTDRISSLKTLELASATI